MARLSFWLPIGTAVSLLPVMTNCSLDDSLVTHSSTTETALYSITVSVTPSSAFRSTDTWNAWVNPVETQFLLKIESEHEDEHLEDVGDHHEEVHHGDIVIGEATLDGMQIVLTADDHGADMYRVHHDEVEHDEAPHGTRFFMLHLYDVLHDQGGHAPLHVGYSDVSIMAVSGEDTQDVALLPVHTVDGFRYESNAFLPPGTWDLHVEAEPPEFARLQGHEALWTDHMEAEFHEFSHDGVVTSTTEVGAVETGGLKFELFAGAVSPFGAIGTGALPLRGDENIRFSLSLEDHAVESDATDLFYATIQMQIHNEATGVMSQAILEPVYGPTGFHYGANILLPAGTLTGSQEEEEDGNGHGH